MNTQAVVMAGPEAVALRRLRLNAAGPGDVVVDVAWSGISAGTERLLWQGRMPWFPGLGYPLVPGYEAVGQVWRAGRDSGRRKGEWVFVPGASCYAEARGLFGASASRVVVAGARTVPVDEAWAERAVLLALAATAHHAVWGTGGASPQLIVGHGVLGRLLARLTLARGGPAPVVWETEPRRRSGAEGYAAIDPADDDRRYGAIYDVSGAGGLLDTLIARLHRGGEIVLAGFYSAPLRFDFAPAFQREARLRVAAEWSPADLAAVIALVRTGRLSLDGLITHRAPVADVPGAYLTAFNDPECVKMVLDWRRAA